MTDPTMRLKRVDSGTGPGVVVLVTGFGAFPGAPSNPSAAIVARLARHRARLARLGIRLETVILPVVFGTVGEAARAASASARPDAILHVGLAGRRRAVSVETRAINRAGPLHPDAARRCPRQILDPGGAPVHAASYAVDRIVVAMRAEGIAVARSIDAGDYVCNATLYATLLGGLAPAAGFIHVPRPRSASWPRCRVRRRRPSLADLTRAVLAAVIVMGRDARRGGGRA